LAGLAHLWVKSAYAKASKIAPRSGCTGAQAAKRIMQQNGIHDVSVEPVQGFLSDHYDPTRKVLRLSPDVYQGRSLAAVGIAAHETGHAIQDAQGYSPLVIRNAIVPMASIGSNLSMVMIIVGFWLGAATATELTFGRILMLAGIAFFALVVLFQIVNLPVEFNASSRARQLLLAGGIVTQDEDRQVANVLRAAAMTYVAATITAIVQLLYWLWRAGLLGGRRD
jgi:Zn-dependent membrane protease YugP